MALCLALIVGVIGIFIIVSSGLVTMPGVSVSENIVNNVGAALAAAGAEEGGAALSNEYILKLVTDIRAQGNTAASAAGGRSVPRSNEQLVDELAHGLKEPFGRLYRVLPSSIRGPEGRDKRRQLIASVVDTSLTNTTLRGRYAQVMSISASLEALLTALDGACGLSPTTNTTTGAPATTTTIEESPPPTVRRWVPDTTAVSGPDVLPVAGGAGPEVPPLPTWVLPDNGPRPSAPPGPSVAEPTPGQPQSLRDTLLEWASIASPAGQGDVHGSFPAELGAQAVSGLTGFFGAGEAPRASALTVEAAQITIPAFFRSARSGRGGITTSTAKPKPRDPQLVISEDDEETEEGDETDEDEDETTRAPPTTKDMEGVVYILQMLRVKQFLTAVDEMFGSVVTFVLSAVASSLLIVFSGPPAAIGAGIIVSFMSFWRWTVHTTDFVVAAATGGAAAAVTAAASTGSYLVAGLGCLVGIAAMIYGCVTGAWHSEISRGAEKITSKTGSKAGSKKGSGRASRKASRAGDDPSEIMARDAQLAEMSALLAQRDRELEASNNAYLMMQAGQMSGSSVPNDGQLSATMGNFNALQDFAIGGNPAMVRSEGPMTVTGAAIGLGGPPPAPAARPGVPGIPAHASSVAPIAGGGPAGYPAGMGNPGGGYALPGHLNTPKFGTYGGAIGAPPTSSMIHSMPGNNPAASPCQVCLGPCRMPHLHFPNPAQFAHQGGPPPLPLPAIAGGGGNQDPYLTGIGATQLPDDYRRMGSEVYWNARRVARTMVEYVERTYPGDRQDAGFRHLLTLAQNIDSVLETAHSAGGLPAVAERLARDNPVEVSLNTIAATYYALQHGDPVGAQELLAFRPPGSGGILPHWAVQDARLASKAGYQEHERQSHGWGSNPVSGTAPPLVNLKQRVTKPPVKPGNKPPGNKPPPHKPPPTKPIVK
jgi:hypothetical protein